ncbi:hypothetical protein N7373_10525 [Achromobacter mucicolens]|uniref:hypothetical protein n=1 Tax=Achromobacter mucicolens TaxID=1389922 RepID=UPI00244934B3|nr:hypothetical protein [Achromobacter mucicolens]MDH0091875.1 hypothetical protein [Achromobacter mucicolens]
MALLPINLNAMARAAKDLADRQLVRYLRQDMAAILQRLPGDSARVPYFVAVAGQYAEAAGYYQGRAYSVHLMISFLLGLRWPNDPACAGISTVLTDQGTDWDTRLDLALNLAISERRQLENALPEMHAITARIVMIPPDQLTLRDMWDGFHALARLRGLASEDMILRCFEAYEADFRQWYRLQPIQRKQLDGYARLGRQKMGLPLPTPIEDIVGLDQRLVVLLTQSVLLDLSFGRASSSHPLLSTLHQVLQESDSRLRASHLHAFLQTHQRLLNEKSHD